MCLIYYRPQFACFSILPLVLQYLICNLLLAIFTTEMCTFLHKIDFLLKQFSD